MKYCYLFIALFVVISCSKTAKSELNNSDTFVTDSISKENQVLSNSKPKMDWQVSFNLTHNSSIDTINGMPVKFYIENKKCDSLAITFYYGKYRPTDDDLITNLLNLSSTDDEELRPFYLWILDKTIEIADGALAEYPGIPARKYAEKFPEELFKFIDADTTKNRYSNWTDIISYSGFYEDDDYKNPKLIRKNLVSEMLKNSSSKLQNRITKFASDCFPDVNKIDQ